MTVAFEYATTPAGFMAFVNTFAGGLAAGGATDGVGTAARFWSPEVLTVLSVVLDSSSLMLTLRASRH